MKKRVTLEFIWWGYIKNNKVRVEFTKTPFTLTQHQIDFLISVTKGERNFPQMGSTRDLLAKKIQRMTGWEMKPVQLFCRFAYRMGFAQL